MSDVVSDAAISHTRQNLLSNVWSRDDIMWLVRAVA